MRADLEQAVTIGIIVTALAMMAFVVIIPISRNCKITATVKIQSFILVGSTIVPYNYELPIQSCTKQV